MSISKIQRFILLGFIAILTYQLLVPPIIGVANNGDFERIMNWGSIMYQTEVYEDRYWNFVNTVFDIVKKVPDGSIYYFSTQAVILKTAVIFNKLFAKDGQFHLISLGIVHMVLYALAAYLILRSSMKMGKSALIITGVLLIVIFGGSSYVAYFNSFYSDPSALIFLLMSVGILLNMDKDKPKLWLMIAFTLSLIMIVGSKAHNCIIGIPLALYGFRLALHYKEKTTRYAIIALSCILLIFSVWFFQNGNPKEFRGWNIYHGVFTGILWDSPNREQDLKDLGLNPDYAKFGRTDVFMAESAFKNETMREDILSKLSTFSIIKFYMFHPDRLYWMLNYAADRSMQVNVDKYLGNFDKPTSMEITKNFKDRGGKPTATNTHAFTLWEKIRNHFPKSVWFIFGFYAVYLAVILKQYLKKRTILAEFMILLPVLSLILFSTVIMGDGTREVEKHLFLFNLMFDITVAASIFWLFITSKKIIIKNFGKASA